MLAPIGHQPCGKFARSPEPVRSSKENSATQSNCEPLADASQPKQNQQSIVKAAASPSEAAMSGLLATLFSIESTFKLLLLKVRPKMLFNSISQVITLWNIVAIIATISALMHEVQCAGVIMLNHSSPVLTTMKVDHQRSSTSLRTVLVNQDGGQHNRTLIIERVIKMMNESHDADAIKTFEDFIRVESKNRQIVFKDEILLNTALQGKNMTILYDRISKKNQDIHWVVMFNETIILIVRRVSKFYYWSVGQTTGAIVIFIMIVAGNSSILLRLKSSRRRRSNVNYFIVQLAIADLFVGVFSVTLDILLRYQKAFTYGLLACRAYKYISVLFIYSSTNLLVALSIDRWEAVVKPLAFTRNRSRGHHLVLGAWIVACVSAAPVIFFTSIKPIDGIEQCWIDLNKLGWQVYMIYLTCLVLVIPTFIIAVCYIHIVYTIWSKGQLVVRQQKEEQQRRRQLESYSAANKKIQDYDSEVARATSVKSQRGSALEISGQQKSSIGDHQLAGAFCKDTEELDTLVGSLPKHRSIHCGARLIDNDNCEIVKKVRKLIGDTKRQTTIRRNDRDADDYDNSLSSDDCGYNGQRSVDDAIPGTESKPVNDSTLRSDTSSGDNSDSSVCVAGEDKRADRMVQISATGGANHHYDNAAVGNNNAAGVDCSNTAAIARATVSTSRQVGDKVLARAEDEQQFGSRKSSGLAKATSAEIREMNLFPNGGQRQTSEQQTNKSKTATEADLRGGEKKRGFSKWSSQGAATGPAKPSKCTSEYVTQQHGSGVIPKARIKTIKMTLVIVVAYILCWSPFCILNLCSVFGLIENNTNVTLALMTLTQSLAHLNSAVNPIIFWLFSSRRSNLQSGSQATPATLNANANASNTEAKTTTAASEAGKQSKLNSTGLETKSSSPETTSSPLWVSLKGILSCGYSCAPCHRLAPAAKMLSPETSRQASGKATNATAAATNKRRHYTIDSRVFDTTGTSVIGCITSSGSLMSRRPSGKSNELPGAAVKSLAEVKVARPLE